MKHKSGTNLLEEPEDYLLQLGLPVMGQAGDVNDFIEELVLTWRALKGQDTFGKNYCILAVLAVLSTIKLTHEIIHLAWNSSGH